MFRISVDCMGGDNGLSVTVPAALNFLKKNKSVSVILVGNPELLKKELKKQKNTPRESYPSKNQPKAVGEYVWLTLITLSLLIGLGFLIKNRIGSIIGITSVIGITGNSGQANYSASKSGMIGMYKSIALEVAQRNIRVNTIAPGFIKTFMTDKLLLTAFWVYFG